MRICAIQNEVNKIRLILLHVLHSHANRKPSYCADVQSVFFLFSCKPVYQKKALEHFCFERVTANSIKFGEKVGEYKFYRKYDFIDR